MTTCGEMQELGPKVNSMVQILIADTHRLELSLLVEDGSIKKLEPDMIRRKLDLEKITIWQEKPELEQKKPEPEQEKPELEQEKPGPDEEKKRVQNEVLNNVVTVFNALLEGGKEHDEALIDYSGFLSAAIAYAYLTQDLKMKITQGERILRSIKEKIKKGKEVHGVKNKFPDTMDALIDLAHKYQETTPELYSFYPHDVVPEAGGNFGFFDQPLELPEDVTKREELMSELNMLVELTYSVMLHYMATVIVHPETGREDPDMIQIARRVFGRPIGLYNNTNSQAHPGFKHDLRTRTWFRDLAQRKLDEETSQENKASRILIDADVYLLDDFTKMKTLATQWHLLHASNKLLMNNEQNRL